MAERSRRGPFLRITGATLLALVGAIVASFGNLYDRERRLSEIAPAVGGAVLLLLAGSIAVRAAASAVREGASERVGEARGATLAKVVSVAGYIVVALWTLSALGVRIQALLLGGALTGVILGIAAQQTLGNVFAGIVLLVVRPFTVGEKAVIKTTLGQYEGVVTNIGFFYVTIATESGRVDVPNALALASAVGPGLRSEASEGEAPEEIEAPENIEAPEAESESEPDAAR